MARMGFRSSMLNHCKVEAFAARNHTSVGQQKLLPPTRRAGCKHGISRCDYTTGKSRKDRSFGREFGFYRGTLKTGIKGSVEIIIY